MRLFRMDTRANKSAVNADICLYVFFASFTAGILGCQTGEQVPVYICIDNYAP